MTEVVTANPAAGWGEALDSQLARLEERLIAEFGGDMLAERAVREHLAGARQNYADARVRRYLPILIERGVPRRQGDSGRLDDSNLAAPTSREAPVLRCQGVTAALLTDRRSPAHSPVDGRHVPRIARSAELMWDVNHVE